MGYQVIMTYCIINDQELNVILDILDRTKDWNVEMYVNYLIVLYQVWLLHTG